MKLNCILFILLFGFFQSYSAKNQTTANLSEVTVAGIRNDSGTRKITITSADQKLSLVIDYSAGCKISRMLIGGKNVLSPMGIYTGFRTKGEITSLASGSVLVKHAGNLLSISNISYTDGSLGVKESWSFRLSGNKIIWDIMRAYDNRAEIEETYFPQWNLTA